MTNTTIKVTPTSRGNFSKLRKYKEGGVPKYLNSTTEGGVQRRYTNTGYTAGNNSGWSESIFTPEFQEKLFSEIKNPNTTPERRKQLVQAINATQQAYEDLRKTRSISTPALFELEVLDYLKRIIELYPALNQIGIANGVNTGRYTYAKNRVTGDNAGEDGSWSNSADGVYGAQTNDRTILGYDGDWDELGDRFKLMNLGLKSFGYQVSKGLNGQEGYTNAYYINEIPAEEEITDGTTGSSDETGGTTNTYTNRWKPTDYDETMDLKFEPLKDWNTAPLWNGALLGNTLFANKRVNDTIKSLKMNRPLALNVYGQMDSDYFYLKGTEDQKSQNNAFGSRLMGSTSDLTQGLHAALAANALNNKLAELAAEHHDATYRLNIKEGDLRKTLQSAYDTNAYNVGQDRATAYQSKLIISDAEKIGKDAQALEDNLVSNRVEGETFNKMNWLNLRDLYNSLLSNYAQRENYKLLADYEKAKDLTLNKAFQNYYNSLFDKNGEVIGNPNWGFDYTGHSIQDFADFVTSNTNEDYQDDFNTYTADWKNKLKTADKDFADNRRDLNLYISMMSDKTPLQYSGQHTFQGYNIMNGRAGLFGMPNWTPQYGKRIYKEGGKVSSSEDRFLKYILHNLKMESVNRDRVLRYTKNSQDMLKRDLNALDRETLLLLREIFK